MLQLFHKYRRTFLGVLILAVIVLIMTGFGLDYYSRGNAGNYAIKVNDVELSYEQLSREREMLEAQYRQMLGDNYYELMDQLKINVAEQVVDKVINEQLLVQFAHTAGMRVGSEELRRTIAQQFPQGFDPALYSMMLSQLRMTSDQFEQHVRRELLRTQLTTLLQQSMVASKAEIDAMIVDAESKYDVSIVSFEPKNFVEKVAAPSGEVLRDYFERQQTNYELPARVTFSYAVLRPDDFLSIVPVSDDDVEIFYSEHERRFTNPERAKIRQIELKIPADANQEQRDLLKARATEVLQRLRSGEPFASVALEVSDDLGSKASGGDVGWITAGKTAAAIEKAAFALKQGGLSDVIDSGSSYFILEVEEYLPAAPKPLAEVRDEIVREIQTQEAPAFVSEHAHALLDKWSAADTDLMTFGAQEKLVVSKSGELLSASSDPDPLLSGLTRRVLENGTERRQVIDVAESTLLVEVTEFRDEELPAFETLQDKVLANWKQEQALGAARQAAQTALEQLKSNTKSVSDLAKEHGGLLRSEKGLTRTKPGAQPPFSDPEIRKAIFSLHTSKAIAPEVVAAGGSHHIVAVDTVTPPTEEEMIKLRQTYEQRAPQELGRSMVASLIAQLKARAEVDVAPSLIAAD